MGNEELGRESGESVDKMELKFIVARRNLRLHELRSANGSGWFHDVYGEDKRRSEESQNKYTIVAIFLTETVRLEAR